MIVTKVSGPQTGKSFLGTSFALGAAARGAKVIYVAQSGPAADFFRRYFLSKAPPTLRVVPASQVGRLLAPDVTVAVLDDEERYPGVRDFVQARLSRHLTWHMMVLRGRGVEA